MNYWVTVYRTAWSVLGIVCVVAVAFIFLPTCRRLDTLEQERAKLSAENRELALKTKRLRGKERKFVSDPGYVEHTAREMGMVKDGEIIFKFTNETSTTRSNGFGGNTEVEQ
ncbi:MAG: septum formation initiator family protein [Kiritimatiellia bacterium]